MNDVWIVGFSGFVGAMMFYTRCRQRKKHQKCLKDLLVRQRFEKIDQSGKIRIACLVSVFGFLILFAVGGILKSIPLMAFGVLMTLILSGELLVLPERYTFYYNDRACILEDRIIEYRSIRSIEPGIKAGIKGLIIQTDSGRPFTIPAIAWEVLKEKLIERRKRKHGRTS